MCGVSGHQAYTNMKKITLPLSFLFLLALLAPAQDPSWHQVPAEDLRGNRGEIARTIHATQDETFLLEIWQRSEVDEDILYLKMLAGKRLGLYGTKASVPVLVQRLDNDQDGFFARYALETIPGTEVDVALGEALKTLERPAAIAGVLTTLGVRSNPVSAETARSFLTHDDIDVRRAAGYAFALTAGESGIEFFTDANLNPIFIDSAFLFAEQFAQKGNNAAAMKVYDALSAAAHVREYQKMAAIYQGALVRGLEGAIWLYRQITADSPRRLFEVGLKAGRELPAGDDAVVARLLVMQFTTQTDPLRQANLVRALGDRTDVESKAFALRVASQFAQSGDVAVRVAAIDALRNVGDVSVVPMLIESAIQTDEQRIADAARNTLIELPGTEIDEAISASLERMLESSGDAAAKTKIALINIIAERRIFAAASLLLKFLQDTEASVVEAAVPALGQISSVEDLPMLLGLLREASSEAETQKFLEVLKSACTRFSQDAAATEVAKFLDGASTALKTHLLDLLKEIAGAKALTIVNDYAWGDDAAMRNVATRILGEWRSPRDLDQLAAACLRLAKESEEYKIRGLRGYIRLARQFDMPEERRLSMTQEVFDLADRDEERVLIFDVFTRTPSIRTLETAIAHLDDAAFRERAAETAVAIAERVQGRDARITAAMQKVLEASSNAQVRERAQRVLER